MAEGMHCPHCDSDDTDKKYAPGNLYYWYICHRCHYQWLEVRGMLIEFDSEGNVMDAAIDGEDEPQE